MYRSLPGTEVFRPSLLEDDRLPTLAFAPIATATSVLSTFKTQEGTSAPRCLTTPIQDHLSIFSSVLEPKALCIPRRPMMHSLPSVPFFLQHQRLSLGSAKTFCPARACVWFAFGVRQNNISMLPRDLKWLICLIFNFSLLVLLYN